MTQALALSTRRVTIRYILFYSACLPVKATTESPDYREFVQRKEALLRKVTDQLRKP